MDMWSLGCIIAELYSGDILFPGHHDAHQLALIMEMVAQHQKMVPQQQKIVPQLPQQQQSRWPEQKMPQMLEQQLPWWPQKLPNQQLRWLREMMAEQKMVPQQNKMLRMAQQQQQ
ncbi:unnamed protein product [Lampetra fluviatilis]